MFLFVCDCFSFNPADGCHINKLVLYRIVTKIIKLLRAVIGVNQGAVNQGAAFHSCEVHRILLKVGVCSRSHSLGFGL